jgi:preprotein translocase subunit SecG
MNQRSEQDQQQAINIFNSFRDELYKRQLSNTENYDKAILTLSSAGLAISLTFIKDIVPLEKADFLFLIKFGWVCFLISIVVSIIAYLMSNKAIDVEMDKAEKYYVNGDESAFSKKNHFSTINNILNRFTGLSFVVAIIAIVMFVILNLRENTDMSNKPSNTISLSDSAIIPRMQAVASLEMQTNSANIPRMQAAPNSGAQSQATQSQSSASSASIQSK